jgi:hypothetical protein
LEVFAVTHFLKVGALFNATPSQDKFLPESVPKPPLKNLISTSAISAEVIDVVRKDNSLLRAELNGLRQELQDIKQLLRGATPAVAVSGAATAATAASAVVVPKEAPAGDDTGEIHVDG